MFRVVGYELSRESNQLFPGVNRGPYYFNEACNICSDSICRVWKSLGAAQDHLNKIIRHHPDKFLGIQEGETTKITHWKPYVDVDI